MWGRASETRGRRREREIRNCRGGKETDRISLTGRLEEEVRSGGENYIVTQLRSVKLQGGEER